MTDAKIKLIKAIGKLGTATLALILVGGAMYSAAQDRAALTDGLVDAHHRHEEDQKEVIRLLNLLISKGNE